MGVGSVLLLTAGGSVHWGVLLGKWVYKHGNVRVKRISPHAKEPGRSRRLCFLYHGEWSWFVLGHATSNKGLISRVEQTIYSFCTISGGSLRKRNLPIFTFCSNTLIFMPCIRDHDALSREYEDRFGHADEIGPPVECL